MTADATTPDAIGSWSGLLDWGLQAKHMAALPTGRVLVWSTGANASVWDPTSGTLTPAPALFGDLHCAGQSMLADGRIIVVGGQNGSPHNGTSITSLFDPTTQTWTRGADLAYMRWYATSTTLADGRVLATSGDAPDGSRATIPEIYDPVANTWTKLTGASRAQSLYPLMFVLPNGSVFEAGPGTATAILDPTGTGHWTAGPTNGYATNGYSESAVMYAPGKILRAGGGDPAINRASVIDMTAATPAWRDTNPMAFPRRRMNLTILADGSVLAIGGTRSGDDASQAVLESEIWDPATEQWTTVAGIAEPRMYHSSAVLLVDGRVVVGGGEAAGRLRSQVYSPSYLFRGPRPVIADAPATVPYGSGFTISTPDAASITSVALIRMSAATHAFDQNQRYVPLAFSAGSGSLNVAGPASGGVAPPGPYQLVIKTAAGIPSIATVVRVDSGTNLQPGTIRGTVTDARTGLPIAGASVTAGGIQTASDGSGSYVLTPVPSGDQVVSFAATGYASVVRNQTVVAGRTYQLDVALAAPGSLSGTVTDHATGLPLAGATITFPGGETATDANGQYAIPSLASGSVVVAASAAGHISVQSPVTIAPGGSAVLDFALDVAATYIAGGVTDIVTGQPLAGATVTVTGGPTTTTDALGRYRFDVGAGTYTLTASAAGYQASTHDAIVTTGAYTISDFGLAVAATPPAILHTAPSADAEISLTSPTKNAGTGSTFRIRAGTSATPATYESYLKFDVNGIAGRTVTGIKLRLYATDGSDDGGHVSAAGNGWTETGITWATAPAIVGPVLGSAGRSTTGTWTDIDLAPSAVTADGTYTFAIVSSSSDSGYYQSRSGTNKPDLQITLGSGGPPPPPPPGAPIAAFTASPASGPAPLSVTVVDTSGGGTPTSWAWDFGDGTSSIVPAPPAHSYGTAGTYTIRLTVGNAGGSSSVTHQVVANAGSPPPPASRLVSMTFEAGKLVDPTTGAGKISGAVSLETASPLSGADSARVSGANAAYLERGWTAVDDVSILATFRFAALPTGSVRILQITDAGTTVGNLNLQSNGALRLRNGSTTIGADSAPLTPGAVYRLALHQRRGTGANAVLEAFVVPLGTPFGSRFAAKTNGSWTTAADRLRIGITSGAALNLVVDDVFVDPGPVPPGVVASFVGSGSAPGAILALGTVAVPATTQRVASPLKFVCTLG